MKVEYKSPVTELVPLSMDQSLCQTSLEKYLIISGELDDDSD